MKKLAFILGLCIIAVTSFAQKKAVKDANSERKAKKFDVARSIIKDALTNPETENQAETWYVAGMIEYGQFEVEKLKEIEGQTPDHDKMYPALDRAYPYLLKADSLDMLPDAKGRVRPKYRKEIRQIIQDNRPYFYNAADYFYKKKNNRKAYENFMLYGDIPKLSMFDDDPVIQAQAILEGDSIGTTIRYYAGVAAAAIPDPDAAIKIFEQIKDYGVTEDHIYKLLISQYHQKQDTANYIRVLKLGAEKFPDESYYLLNLINISFTMGNLQDAEDFIKKAIEVTPDNAQLHDVLGLVYEHNKDYDSAIATIKKALEINPNFSEALSHLGRLYYNLGVEKRTNLGSIEDKDAYDKEMVVVNSYFKESIPYFEKALELNSKDKEAIFALRNMYYSLGLNDKYEKMDKIYNEME